jgi:coenzyme F420-dependent glucose-6-phosphate dehydrogenase
MNETPPTGMDWPPAKERRRRMAEAITLMRKLWTEERVDFEGDYYRTVKATLYDRPEEPPPIFVAASGPLAAKLTGRVADGFICTSGKDPELYRTLLENVAEGAAEAGRDLGEIEKMIEIKVSYDTDLEKAKDACRWWAALALTPEEKSQTEDPIELERLADAIGDRGQTRFIVSDDADAVVDAIRGYVDLGFEHLLLHGPTHDQERFLELFARDVLPGLRKLRVGAPA